MLLEYRNEAEDGSATGWRVTKAGAVEELDGKDWSEAFRLDAGGLGDLRDAIHETLGQVDQDHYQPEGGVSHPRRLTWRLEDAGETRQIVIDGFPVMKVAPLDELLQTLLRLRFRDEGQISTVWTWQSDGGEKCRRFDGEPAEVPELQPLLELVLPSDGAEGGKTDSGGGEPLLEVQWLVGGKPGDAVVVRADGRRIQRESGTDHDAGRLSEAQVGELRERLKKLGSS